MCIRDRRIARKDIYITELTPVQQLCAFGLLWDLDAVIIINREEHKNVKTTFIGGSMLKFHTKNDTLENSDKIKYIIVIWENGDKTLIPCMISKQYKTRYNVYCDFQYVGISDAVRDKIFKKLFEKQCKLNRVVINIKTRKNSVSKQLVKI